MDSERRSFIRWHCRPRISRASAVSSGLLWVRTRVCRLRHFIALLAFFFFFLGKHAVLTNPGRTQKWYCKSKAAAIKTSDTAAQSLRSPETARGGPGPAWDNTHEKGLRPPVRPACTEAMQRAGLRGCRFPLNWETAEPLLSKTSSFLQRPAERSQRLLAVQRHVFFEEKAPCHCSCAFVQGWQPWPAPCRLLAWSLPCF